MHYFNNFTTCSIERSPTAKNVVLQNVRKRLDQFSGSPKFPIHCDTNERLYMMLAMYKTELVNTNLFYTLQSENYQIAKNRVSFRSPCLLVDVQYCRLFEWRKMFKPSYRVYVAIYSGPTLIDYSSLLKRYILNIHVSGSIILVMRSKMFCPCSMSLLWCLL